MVTHQGQGTSNELMDPYQDLGVRPVINAAATLTKLGGSVLAPGVAEAMAAASRQFIDIIELHERVGERLATLTRNEAAYVSCGAAAGITLTTAACIAGASQLEAFPELEGVARPEVVVYRSQRNEYEYAARQIGARLVEIDDGVESLAAALSERTACVLWFAGAHLAAGALPIEDVVPIAHARGVPVIVDAAAQIPPISSLWHFTTEVDADAVLFSGGKGLRGPQASGLVLGRRAIIDACRAHGSPHHAVGRPMKVGKEELIGLLTAVEWSLAQDEVATIAGYDASVARWVDGLSGIDGVQVRRGFPSEAGQPHGRALVRFAPYSSWTRDEVVKALWEGDPRIAVGIVGDDTIALNPQTLEPDQDLVVLQALQHLLTNSKES